MRIDTYHAGGFVAAAPQQNRAERLDSSTGFTSWDIGGNVTLQRALTAAEVTLLAASDTGNTRVSNADSLKAKADAAIATNIAALALPNPTAANTTYINSANLVASATAAQVQAYVRLMDAQIRALTNQNNALVAQVRALTNQITAMERLAVNRLEDTSGT